MTSNMFHRNMRARELRELFFLVSISSLLLVRLYLYLTGFPQIGGGGLHIAHVLWGGLLMLVALIVSLSFMGIRALYFTAVIGGIGFGLFIDELGKFITHNNNYFYEPAAALIYAVFLVLYLVISVLGKKKQPSSRDYKLTYESRNPGL